MFNPLNGNTTPTTYTLRPREESGAGLDTDNNGIIDDQDSFLTLHSDQGLEVLDIRDLRQALTTLGADKRPVDDTAVLGELCKQYNDDSLTQFGIANGTFNYDSLTTYRHKQSFQLEGEDIKYTLQFDPAAPIQKWNSDDESAQGSAALVKNPNGVLHWELPTPPEAPPLPDGAVIEPTQVRRDGVLYWLWPGEVPQPGDEIMGTAKQIEERAFGK